MRLLTKVNAFIGRTIGLLAFLGAILVVFVMLLVAAHAGMRYFLGRPIPGVIEISEYALLYITFLVAAWVLRREGHVKMDLVLNQLEPRTQILLNIITSIISAIICLVIAWYGTIVTWDHFQVGFYYSTPLRTPAFIIVAIVPIGSFLLFIQFLNRTRGYLDSWRTHQLDM
jgi:TRAP-type C4-dicarboxylate transport system permease small subunit